MSSIKWVKYAGYEGWSHWGDRRLRKMVKGDTPEEIALRLVTEAEGGHWDAVQCYDAGIMTAGPIQLTARWGLLQNFLWECLLASPGKFSELFFKPMFNRRYWIAPLMGNNIERHTGHQAVFWSNLDGDAQTSRRQLRHVYLGGTSGLQGSWDDRTKAVAKSWVEALVALLRDESFHSTILKIQTKQMMSFLFADSQRILIAQTGDSRLHSGHRAVDIATGVFLGYAINNPQNARRALLAAEGLGTTEPFHETLMNIASGPGYIHTFPKRTRSMKKQLTREFLAA